MKKVTWIVLCLVLCGMLSAFALTGCAGPAPKEEETTTAPENDAAVVGTWGEDVFESGFTFNEDGTGRENFWNLTFSYTAYDGVITITYDDTTYAVDKYTYTTDGSTITMTRQQDGSQRVYEKR